MYLVKKVEYLLEARGYRTKNGIKCFNIEGKDMANECECIHKVMFLNKPISKDEAYNKLGFREDENIGIIEYCNTYSIIKQFDLRTTLRLVVHKREERIDGYILFVDKGAAKSFETNATLLQNRNQYAIILLKNENGQYLKIDHYMIKVVDGQLIQTA